MGAGNSAKPVYEGFGMTRDEAINSLNSVITYRYGNSLVVYKRIHYGYMYGGELLEVKYSESNNIVRAYVDLR
ncbi:MAG TPA: hypothetical protein PKD85_00295 [Saprospiraceae bacterium]|nr:hypothetical protein [Saprospiraceae bacterium]